MVSETTQPIWKPNLDSTKSSNMQRFMEYVNDAYGLEIRDYNSLHQWSIHNKETFWESVWKFCNVISSQHWDSPLIQLDNFPGFKWFPGARLNFAENLLRWKEIEPNKLALVFRSENKVKTQLTYSELYSLVAKLAKALKNNGVQVGDRVAGFLPNMPETVAAMLATTSIGAVWSSCSPDFGVNGVLDRFGQIEPKVLFCADGYYFKGKSVDSLDTVISVSKKITSLKKIIVIPYVGNNKKINNIDRACSLENFIEDSDDNDIHFEQLPFDHPLYIMYSSGTTGKPKCIIHGIGGTLLQHLKEHVLHTNIASEDNIFYFTTCGWMMWNWLVSGLATGATLFLYDGNPLYPDANSLFRYADEENFSVFGTSAKFLSAVEKSGARPNDQLSLTNLKTILSTGSPLAPESYEFVQKHINGSVQLSSISGGTDIISCFALGNPLLPVYKGELQCFGLGMDIDVRDEDGNSIRELPGELCCRLPFPSMPIGFWNDNDYSKYKAAYFEKFPGIWAHGDYAEITLRNGLIIYGRSDAVLNPGGVRIGTAEIYRQVEKLPEIVESIAIGQEWNNDVRIILFVKLQENVTLNDELKARIGNSIRDNTTPRHVPAKIIQISDIPRTISGKIVEIAVKNVIHNRPVKNIDALANPNVLDEFKNLKELQE